MATVPNLGIRFLIIAVITVVLAWYIYSQKDHSKPQLVVDVELFITLALTILYTFTSNIPLWNKYYWIWRTIIILTLVGYLVRLLMTRPSGWENKATSAVIFILIFGMKLARRV